MTLKTKDLIIEYTYKEVYRNESPFRLSIVSSVSIQSIKASTEIQRAYSARTLALQCLMSEYTSKYPAHKYRLHTQKGVDRDTRILRVSAAESQPSVKDISLDIVFSFCREDEENES